MTENTLILLFCGTPFALIAALVYTIRHYRRQLTAVNTQLRKQTEACVAATTMAIGYRADATLALRDHWLATLPDLTYRNEVEVESKLIVPLLHHLGHPADQWQQRVKIDVPVGRNTHTGEADFVVREPNGRVTLIVEAKAPAAPLDAAAQAQARSYAYALNAPRYLLTNGRLLQLWQRGVVEDVIIVECAVAELAAVWEEIAKCTTH